MLGKTALFHSKKLPPLRVLLGVLCFNLPFDKMKCFSTVICCSFNHSNTNFFNCFLFVSRTILFFMFLQMIWFRVFCKRPLLVHLPMFFITARKVASAQWPFPGGATQNSFFGEKVMWNCFASSFSPFNCFNLNSSSTTGHVIKSCLLENQVQWVFLLQSMHGDNDDTSIVWFLDWHLITSGSLWGTATRNKAQMAELVENHSASTASRISIQAVMIQFWKWKFPFLIATKTFEILLVMQEKQKQSFEFMSSRFADTSRHQSSSLLLSFWWCFLAPEAQLLFHHATPFDLRCLKHGLLPF